MADAIKNRKMEQSSYLRQIQQDKAAKKRELMAQQQQDLVSMRQYYSEETKKVDQESADAVNHIRAETAEINRTYSDDKRQRQEEIKLRQQQDRQADLESRQNSVGQSGVENKTEEGQSPDRKTIYNRQAQKKTMIQNYETKESDDFYRVQNRGSRVSEDNNKYVIEAYAPEHEKDHLKVSVQRDKAIISGKRKFGDEVQEGNKKMRTNNFQTFREEFKFNRPVSSDGMTRERIGDFVRFTIPKLEAVGEPDENS